MYKVYFLDGYEITGVLSVESTHSREIKTFNGLGQGYYAIPDNEDLKAWVIKCQQTDTGLFSVLDKLLQTKDESRLIVSSDTENFSEACYLEEYTKSEESAGVFDVTMKFIEHKPVGYRTSDIPNIPRPGKQPPQPKTVVFDGKKNHPADAFVKNTNGMSTADKSFKQQALYISEFGDVTSNPCRLVNGTPYYVAVDYAHGYGTDSPIDAVVPKTKADIKAEKERKGCELFLETLQKLDDELKGKKKPTSKSSNNPFAT